MGTDPRPTAPQTVRFHSDYLHNGKGMLQHKHQKTEQNNLNNHLEETEKENIYYTYLLNY